MPNTAAILLRAKANVTACGTALAPRSTLKRVDSDDATDAKAVAPILFLNVMLAMPLAVGDASALHAILRSAVALAIATAATADDRLAKVLALVFADTARPDVLADFLAAT